MRNREGDHMKLTMRLGRASYDIILSRGALGRLGKLANLTNRRALVVTDDGVPAQYADAVLAQCVQGGAKLVLKAGEETKSLAGFETILHKLLDEGFTRRDVVVAVGGGVVGDLAGFAAACYMRGVAFINCPTTTLSQVDSSIGGKTAVDFGGVKNIVGAFYQPEIVVIDPDTLDTLPQRHYVNGLAEAVKAGLIGDEYLFELFEEDDVHEHIEEVLCRALAVKKNVVEKDEREKSLRAVLNFGHTIGHAIEAASGGALYHGECVALGMLPMIEDKLLLQRTKDVYKKLGLPTAASYDADKVTAYLRHDKKASSQKGLTVVRVPELGSYRLDKATFEEIETLVRAGLG